MPYGKYCKTHPKTPENTSAYGLCRMCIKHRHKVYYQSKEQRYANGKRFAKKRGIECHINKEDFFRLFIPSTCYYCGQKFESSGFGLDRMDSDKGYTLDNVVMCCTDCNKHKFDSWTVEEAKAAITAVKEVRKVNKIKEKF